jgi:hypothetical protein
MNISGIQLMKTAACAVCCTVHLSNIQYAKCLLQVPSLEVGELLIRSLYQAKPQLEVCSQQQLLELVTLADSLDAKKQSMRQARSCS